jgi:hypothetical protein
MSMPNEKPGQVAADAQIAVAVYETTRQCHPNTAPQMEWLIWQGAAESDGSGIAEELAHKHIAPSCRLSFSGYGRLLSKRPSGDALLTAPYLMPVAMNVPRSELPELDRWYEEEHIDLLLRCADWLQVVRYELRSLTGHRWNRLALHPLATTTPFAELPVQEAVSTPWRLRLAARHWFLQGGRAVLERQEQTTSEMETSVWRSISS